MLLDVSPNHSPTARKGSSKSLIPRNARQLMRRKMNISRAIKREQNVDKINTLKLKIAEIEDDLRTFLHKMRSNKELTARANLIKDPNKLHEIVKKINKKSSRIGPLNRKNISDAEILANQYSKVFTTPKSENIFNDPEQFFKDPEEDMEVQLKTTLNLRSSLSLKL